MHKNGGIIVIVSDTRYLEENDFKQEKIIDVYYSCKGKCDHFIENHYRSKGLMTKWEDISDIIIPLKYLSWNIAILNGIRSNRTNYDDIAFKNLKFFIIKISQITLKQQTEEQIERLRLLSMLPKGI
jgi:hypothetical protein